MKIPGTEIDLCLVCEDEAATHRDDDLGPICVDCIHHAARATVALADAHLFSVQTNTTRHTHS